MNRKEAERLSERWLSAAPIPSHREHMCLDSLASLLIRTYKKGWKDRTFSNEPMGWQKERLRVTPITKGRKKR